MIAALMRLKSDLSSEKFFYLFPHSFVNCIEGIGLDTEITVDDNSSAIEDILFNLVYSYF